MDRQELFETILAFIIVLCLLYIADGLILGIIWLYHLLML